MKRIIAILMSALMMISLVPVADASTVVNYTVSAFVYLSTGQGYNYTMGINERRVYGNSNISSGGYIVTIPRNSESGYLIVAGYYPISTTVTSGTANAWTSPSSYNTFRGYYHIASDLSLPFPINTNGDIGPAFTGIVYVPAHSQTLYLFVGGTSTSLGGNQRMGAMSAAAPIMYFVPDTGGTDYSSFLETLNDSIQSVYQALLTNGQTETAINDKLVEMANTLQLVLSALQSSGGDVSSIVSALDDVNSKLQSTLDQITSSGADDDFTQQILDDMDELMDKIDDLTQQIEDNTNRPPPEDIVPSIPPQLLPPTDETAIAGRDAISGILSSSFFVTFLLMVFSLAFLRYVLFGKSK